MAENTEISNLCGIEEYQPRLKNGNILLDNLSVGVFLVAGEEQIVRVNRALEDFLNTPGETFLAKPYQELFASLIEFSVEPDVIRRELFAAILTVQRNPQVDFSVNHEQMAHWSLTFFPVWDGEGVLYGWGGLLQDVTDANRHVGLQGDLLQDIVHNIRVPLASLKGRSAALLVHHQQWEREMVAEFLKSIEKTVDELIGQVDRSLALFRLENGKFNLRPESVNILSLLQGVLERSAERWPEVNLEFEHSLEVPLVRVDPVRIEEVLNMLFQGAISVEPAPGLLKVKAQTMENWVQISVQSPGFEITRDEQQTIFAKSGSVSAAGKKGIGLNLFITREIIEAHGGQIWIENPLPEFGEGAKVIFTLPVLPEQTDARMASRRITQQTEVAKKILIVDNQPDSQSVMRTILQKEGYEVEVVPTGMSALDIMQTSPPDLVLMDWLLPDINGLNVCRSIRRWSTIPVMMVTSRTSLDDLVTAFQAGVDDYLTKPFLSDELLVRTQALLRRQKSEQVVQNDEIFSRSGLRINFDTREVWARGERVELTPIEYRLLIYMARHPRLVLSYERLIGEVWDSPEAGSRRGLFAHVSRLRQKIEVDPNKPEFIHTRWGVGYVFMPDY